LIKRLLTHDRSKRYGCLKAGAEDVKKHKWYKNICWDTILVRGLAPPFIPSVKAMDDTSMFDKYPESTEASAQMIKPNEQELFEGF